MSVDTGWTIGGESASESEVVESLTTDKDLSFSLSVDGEVVGEGMSIDNVTRALRAYADHPTTATFIERLCYAVAFLAVWVAVGLMAPGALTWVCVVGLIGMVMVNRRVGMERWRP